MERRFYIAYGSNLNVIQMKKRCPQSEIFATAVLKDMQLLFRGGANASFLTVEELMGGETPVAVWSVTPHDEEALDAYEGYPDLYRKQDMTLDCELIGGKGSAKVTAFIYIMRDDIPVGIPSLSYIQTCLSGYESFGFDENALLNAYERSIFETRKKNKPKSE